MSASSSRDTEFLARLRQIVEEQLSNERFGVSELADKIGMSRSNLLRKVSKASGVSVSQFIRTVRLENAAEMLRTDSYTVSEVSYKVGFSSVSYFIKCFREQYGYPPGSISEHDHEEQEEIDGNKDDTQDNEQKRKFPVWIIPAAVVAVVAAVAIIMYVFYLPAQNKKDGPKSIAVLPFLNDSSDSSNVYIINGIMESTLNKLQSIENLRVISRTSVEKYRNNPKTIPEIARELNVNYVVEGSGQKAGDRILLNIQLIEADTDNYLLSRQYERTTDDIFALQSDIAKNIAEEIEVIITPEEQKRIEKAPTENLEAYDEFLKGLEILNNTVDQEELKKAIPYFQKAIRLDNSFARAYAAAAITYYTIEINFSERKYADSINYYADKALFYDPELPQSLISKALVYMAHHEYELAVPYFEKALQYNPSYDLVLYFMVDLYANYIPDTEKYLEYALRGLQIDPTSYDSATNSFNYLHIANAFIQVGFVDLALEYINKSLQYNPENLFSEYVKAYILYAKNPNLQELRSSLRNALNKDPNRLDIAQELAKVCYFQKDYQAAGEYYEKYLAIKNALGLDIYPQENVKIAYTFMQLGKEKEADEFLSAFKAYAENNSSTYKDLNLCSYYAVTGDVNKALSYLDKFSEQEQFHYWTVLFMPLEPILDDLRSQKEYRRIFNKIEERFSDFHDKMEASLEEKGLI